ncbi:MAG: YceI family protein [Solimonas sp.]
MPVVVTAASGDIDSSKSTLTATFKQEGVAVDNPFKKFTGHIVYDAGNVAASSAMIEVETASFDMGSEEYNAEVRKKAWFDSATYPEAVFKSSSIKADGVNKFTATGTLSIKGRSVNLSVPVSVQTTAGVNSFDGTITISRAAFGIGDPAWNDVLEDKVTVHFHFVNVK